MDLYGLLSLAVCIVCLGSMPWALTNKDVSKLDCVWLIVGAFMFGLYAIAHTTDTFWIEWNDFWNAVLTTKV